jgi:hypothetical protein
LRLAANADPAQLYEWIGLAAGPVPKPSLLSRAQRPVTHLEPAVLRALLMRANPLIDLAIATYTEDQDVLQELWKRDDVALRLAIAGNRHRAGLMGVDLMDLLRSGSQELWDIALANPSMSSRALARVLEREDPLDQLSDDQWLRGVRAIARSPVIRLKRSWFDTGSDDWVIPNPEDFISSGEAFAAAWRLPHILEPTEANAELLEALLGAISEFSPPLLEFGWQPQSAPEASRAASQRFVRAMLQKWKRENTPGGAPFLREFEPDYHWGLRVVISAAAAKGDIPDDELRLSGDPAARRGYYRTGEKWTADQIRAAFDRDGADFVMEIVGNEAVHRDSALRDAVEACFERLDRETRHEPTRVWRTVGTTLWRQNRFLYPRPSGRLSLNEQGSTPPIGLEETLKRIEENTYNDFVCDNVWLRDAEKAGEITQTQGARVGFDATWRLARAMFSALTLLSQGMERDRRERRTTIDSIRQALWCVGAIVIIVLVINELRRWF